MGGSAEDHAARRVSLYFAIGQTLSCWLTRANRRYALNLLGPPAALACGLIVARRRRALAARWRPRSAAALLFAGSYTFWSQAVIAEVYALHICSWSR